MWVVSLLILSLLFSITPALADPGFDEKYERDYNIFSPINQYRPDNPLNPINAVDPKNPLNPLNQYDPGNPANPINRYQPNNPFNPILFAIAIQFIFKGSGHHRLYYSLPLGSHSPSYLPGHLVLCDHIDPNNLPRLKRVAYLLKYCINCISTDTDLDQAQFVRAIILTQISRLIEPHGSGHAGELTELPGIILNVGET